ncbi:MAG: hypothetical protein QXI32_03035 [Candidatus Bathyarchaeia archaeon]
MGCLYYLAYSPPKDPRCKRRLEQTLSSQGVLRLHYSLWQIPPKISRVAIDLLQGYQPILMRRSREVVSPLLKSFRLGEDLGTVMILAYRLKGGSSRQRAIVSRALFQSPSLKIGTCLYLFPHMRTSRWIRYQGKILSATEVSELLRREQIETMCFNYLRIVYPYSHGIILKAMGEQQVVRAQRLFESLKHLLEAMESSPLDKVDCRKLISAYRQRYVWLKQVSNFLEHEMDIGPSPILKKIYNALKSCEEFLQVRTECY